MTLTLLIPVYNNYNGLIDTIMSLNIYNSKHKITIMIIDDCSTDGKDYNELIQLFKPFYDVQVYRTPVNGGPGKARQYGLDKIQDDYVMFMDAGDIIYSPVEFKDYLKLVENNPKTLMFSAAHFEQYEDDSYTICNASHNRMHGKIYKVNFLRKYHIQFNDECSNMNEDIGFNFLCRYHCEYLQSLDNSMLYYIDYENPIVIWTFDPNSLTRANNYAFYYKQNVGLGIHGTYAINKAMENGIPFSAIQYNAYVIFIHLYVFYISTLNERPEYLQESFDGALYFYKNILIENPIDQAVLLKAYNDTMRDQFVKNDRCFCGALPTISILDFLTMLDSAYLREKKE